MVRILTTLGAALTAAVAVSAYTVSWATNRIDNGLYLVAPYEGSVWYAGETVAYQWLFDKTDPHRHDDFKIVLTNKYRTYSITDKIEGLHRKGKCGNLGKQSKICAEYRWKVPRHVIPGRYQAVIISNQDESLIRYTEFFHVKQIED